MTAPVAAGMAAAGPFLLLAVLVTVMAWRRSRQRRRSLRNQYEVRTAARSERVRMTARARIGMGMLHPETPGPASDAEAALLAEVLDGIDLTNLGGQP